MSRALLSYIAPALRTRQDDGVPDDQRSASASARAIARDQLTRTIMASARAQLGTVGPAQLSVRAVARDVGMVSSAVYRYFPSRDDLLSALLVACFDEVGSVVERAVAQVPEDDVEGRWSALAHAFRGWAVGHPWDFALLYGSPVPGYVAPRDTVGPANRVTRVLVDLVADLDVESRQHRGTRARPEPALHAAVAGIRAFAGVELSDGLLLAGMSAWSGLVGAVTLELFGHLVHGVDDHPVYFAALVQQLSPVRG